jgi:hypothetical protein
MAKNFLFGKIFFYLAQFFLCLFKNFILPLAKNYSEFSQMSANPLAEVCNSCSKATGRINKCSPEGFRKAACSSHAA